MSTATTKLTKLNGRRNFLRSAAGLGAAFWADDTLDAALQNTNTNSKPSDLKITDLRVAVVARAPMTCPLSRIDTNQGIYGLGEVRDGASKTYALFLKRRLLGENPCNGDKIFRRIKQFGFHARQAGGVYGVEMALWEVAGKAYSVPIYQVLGGNFRDQMRFYADTTDSEHPQEYRRRRKLGKALQKHNMAWLEDMIPWQYTDLWKKITDAIDVPTLTGEDIYLKESFIELAKNHAVDILHPDLATSGGILETKKIGDAIQEHGVPMAMHFAGTPVSCMANVHCAAATENFLVLENHSVDVPWWSDLVDGVEKPIVNKGFVTVPDKPGLGVTLNEAMVKQHLLEPGFFEPTPQWNVDRTNDRQWS